MNAIRNVEIFAAGTWNCDTYTTADLDGIVAAAKELDFRPALKLGHTRDVPGAPAYGWVTNLRRVGQKLVADFESMHASVVNAIRDHRYSRVSAEIYHRLKRGGKTFDHALKAVALLGADVPAVAGLVPLHKVQFAHAAFATHAYERPLYIEGESPQLRAYAASGSRWPEIRPDIVERVPTQAEMAIDRGEAGAEVHRLALEAMRAYRGMDYADALTRVLKDDPELARRYRGVASDLQVE